MSFKMENSYKENSKADLNTIKEELEESERS